MTQAKVTLPSRLTVKINGQTDSEDLIPVERLPDIPAEKITGQLDENQLPDSVPTFSDLSSIYQPLIKPANAQISRTALQIEEHPVQVSAAKPLIRRDGSALQLNDVWLDSNDHTRWFWNGSYWLSATIYSFNAIAFFTTGTTTGFLATGGFNIFLLSIEMAVIFVASAHDAVNNYTLRLRRLASNSAASSVEASLSSSALATPSTRPTYRANLNLHRDMVALSAAGFDFELVKNGTAGNSTISASVLYRLVRL